MSDRIFFELRGITVIFALAAIASGHFKLFGMLIRPKNSLATLDFILLILAFLFIVLVIRVELYNLVDTETVGKDVMFLTLSIWFALFIFQFKALRKRIVFICWTIISLILFGMFFWLHNDPGLNYLDKSGDAQNYSHGLLTPFLVLLFYQICRQLSLKFYKVELALPYKFTNYIYEEKRNTTLLDRICAIGFVVIPFATFYL